MSTNIARNLLGNFVEKCQFILKHSYRLQNYY